MGGELGIEWPVQGHQLEVPTIVFRLCKDYVMMMMVRGMMMLMLMLMLMMMLMMKVMNPTSYGLKKGTVHLSLVLIFFH
jgi:hypothetical protein